MDSKGMNCLEVDGSAKAGQQTGFLEGLAQSLYPK